MKEAVDLLKRGELVAFPTETVYGLGASAFLPEAIAKIFQMKGRPSDNPLIVHISSLEQISSVATDIPQELYRLAERFWPGPLTLVLKRNPCVPPIVSAGLNTVAVRIPAHPVALALITAAGPLVAPSANLSGRPSATTAEHVREDFGDRLPCILDGGATALGIESTVLSLDPYVLLRPGAIPKTALEECLGMSIRDKNPQDAIVSPGMKYRHYAPKAILRLVMSLEEGSVVVTAKNLYATLRQADRQEMKEVVIYLSQETLQDPALLDRLYRAALQS
jgi:L-threonylcarbamoyladenylate synthase